MWKESPGLNFFNILFLFIFKVHDAENLCNKISLFENLNDPTWCMSQFANVETATFN